MRLPIILLLLVCLNNQCEISSDEKNFGKTTIKIEYYVAPKNVHYGWFDNGIFHHDLKQHSIKVPFEKRTFQYNNKKDSIYEMFYFIEEGDSLLLNMLQFSDEYDCKFEKPRILLVIKDSIFSDTIMIDRNKNIKKNFKCYGMKKTLWDKLTKIMPEEIKESWENNLPPKY